MNALCQHILVSWVTIYEDNNYDFTALALVNP